MGNSNKNDKIYLSEEGYRQFEQELQDLRNKLVNNSREKSNAYETAVGDGWHDNFDFEEAKRQEFLIQGLINKKMEDMKNIVIIDDQQTDDEIGINDYINAQMIYGDDDTEEVIIKLVGSSTPGVLDDIQEISLNCPLGKAIYKKHVGDTVSYKVNSAEINVIINGKSQNLDELTAKNKVNKI